LPKLLHLIDTGGPGGAETIFRDIVFGLPGDRWHSVSVVPRKGWLYDALIDRGVDPIVLSAESCGRWAYLTQLRRLIHHHRIDLVHSHLLGAGLYGSLATLGAPVPVLSTFHGLPDFSGRPFAVAGKVKILARKGNRVVFVSEHLRRSVLARWYVPSSRVEVIHNGVQLGALSPTGSERHELGARPGDFLIGAVGNLRPAKDYGTLLRAVAEVRQSGCPVRLAIIGAGGGELEHELMKLRSSLQLDDQVSFMGFRADAHRLISAVDLFVLSSSTEGFSLSTVEALWLGRPVIATRCGGPEEIVRDGVTGVLVPPGDPKALAVQMRRLLDHPQLRMELGARGARDVRDRFSIERMISSYTRIYNDMLEN
jgi:glycosyltransferase involved in cell wall biosynthesis